MNVAPASPSRHPASFRDPAGFIYRDEAGVLHRQINNSYQPDYARLMDSGLYHSLVRDRLLIDHKECPGQKALTREAFKIIKPRELPFISYPYEWSFSALKDAALLTLDIEQRALTLGMTLKDATSYNIQFEGPRPIFIDTLSFERYTEGSPWVAYGQFCRHFLAPLALMAKVDSRLGNLLRLHTDGVPLDLASRTLPAHTCLNFGLTMHLHMQARLVKRNGAPRPGKRAARISKTALLAILDSLRRTVAGLRWNTQRTDWADYYQNNSYSAAAFEQKQDLVARVLKNLGPQTVWDLGANTGVFARLASDLGCRTCAFDIDPGCVESAYVSCRDAQINNILPLLLDLSNPTPGTGWANLEHRSLVQRGPADVILALALIHHLAIANNVPLEKVAEFYAQLGRHLVIEWVPKTDVQVQRMLATRVDIFNEYQQANFEAAFRRYFDIVSADPVADSGRILFVMRAKPE